MSHKPYDVVVVETVAATSGDDASAQGVFQIDAESSTKFFKQAGIPLRAITGWKNEGYTAGAVHIVDVEMTGTTLAKDHEYTVTIKFSKDVTKSWTFSTIFADTAPADVPTIVNALVAKINEATSLGVTASLVDTDDLQLDVDSVDLGEIIVSTSEGSVVSDTQAYVAPVGTVAEVEENGGTAVPANTYDKMSIWWNKPTKHNAVSGLVVGVPTKSILYLDAGANATALRATLEDHLDGTTTATWAGVAGL